MTAECSPTRETPDDEPSPCDAEAFARLRRWGGEKLVREMTQLFLAQVPERIAAARQGICEDNATETEQAAHALKSSCAQLGAVRMQVLCAQIEEVAARRDLRTVPRLVDELEREFVRYVDYLPDPKPNTEVTE